MNQISKVATIFGLGTASLSYIILRKKIFAESQDEPRRLSLLRTKYPASLEYPNLSAHSNYMARNLTHTMYAKLRDRITPSGFTIDNAIQCGVDSPGSPGRMHSGLVAGDEDSYVVFKELFDRVLFDQFNYDTNKIQVHDMKMSKVQFPANFTDKYVQSMRLRVCRNLSNYTFPSWCSRAERREIERIALDAFSKLKNIEDGEYINLFDLDEKDEQQLLNDGIYFYQPSKKYWVSATVPRDWPDARGIFASGDRGFFVYVNGKDHLRICCMTKDVRSFKSVAKQFFLNTQKIEKNLNERNVRFAWDPHFGYLATSPSNTGTGFSASFYLRIPNLSKDARFQSIVKSMGVKLTAANDQADDKISKDLVCIRNIDRIGVSEVEILQKLLNSISTLIEIEQRLEKNESIDDLFDF